MAGQSVLIVEDEKLINWSLVKSLSKWGFEVCPVYNGADAVARLEGGRFDIVLLDYHLPDIDGLQVARHIRAKSPGSVIILLTAFQLSELGVDSGLIDAYFNKPLDLERLREALDGFPRRSRAAI